MDKQWCPYSIKRRLKLGAFSVCTFNFVCHSPRRKISWPPPHTWNHPTTTRVQRIDDNGTSGTKHSRGRRFVAWSSWIPMIVCLQAAISDLNWAEEEVREIRLRNYNRTYSSLQDCVNAVRLLGWSVTRGFLHGQTHMRDSGISVEQKTKGIGLNHDKIVNNSHQLQFNITMIEGLNKENTMVC